MTTEYYDHDGVFPLLWPQLSAHLPLRNLYWKSQARPLRSIASLDVDFVPAPRSTSPRDPRSPGGQSIGNPNIDVSDTRRHQIPGLRSTPYLKLFLLRCDDKDLYKSTLRPRLRDWVKEHVTGPQNSGQQSNHDAFEWLIVHVVLPDTPAAAQPRFSSKKKESDDVKERSSKWPGKRNRPLLEKLRSDFNDGKSGFERVAQIRLARDALPPGLTRAILPEGSKPMAESPQEQQAAWNDLVAKLKALILSSFNVRVSQFEEDVREKELQRSLPGWNFCTFFILKEGLAQAFEAVGLTEDALLGYDELLVGFDSTISDQLAGTSAANQLSSIKSPLLDELTKRAQKRDASDQADSAFGRLVLDIESRDYRGLIVNNQISTFDFRCYIFMRQMALLLKLTRLAPSFQNDKTALARLSSESLAHRNQDATPLAELSIRAAAFASLIARIMRAEMQSGLLDTTSGQKVYNIDTLIASWIFLFLQQVLDETVTSAIVSPASMQEKRSKSEPVRHYSYPKRQSSLITEQDTAANSPQTQKDTLFLQDLNLQDIEVIKNTELANAAACRADLVLRQRRLLEQLGEQKGWRIARLQEAKGNSAATDSEHKSTAISSPILVDVLSSIERFRQSHELLSDHAAWYYAVAGRARSAEQLVMSQALLKFEDGDFAAAATYFSKLAKTYGGRAWRDVEQNILLKYATCLDALNRKDELVRVWLAILAKAANSQMSSRRCILKQTDRKTSLRDMASTEPKCWEALLAASRDLTYDVTAPLTSYFQLVSVDETITRTAEDGDGFSYTINIVQLIKDEVSLDDVKIDLVPVDGDTSRKLVLCRKEIFNLSGHAKSVTLRSNVSTYGVFHVERIVLRAGRISFTHDPQRQDHATDVEQNVAEHGKPRLKAQAKLLVYPRFGALRAIMRHSANVHLNNRRSLEVAIQTNDDSVLGGVVSLKALTAGLRLHTADATMSGDNYFPDNGSSGRIMLGPCEAGSSVQIEVPYSGEHSQDLKVLLTIEYGIGSSRYIFRSICSIEVGAPLDISVQDFLKQDALISKFWIRAMSPRPIKILDTKLEGSECFEVQPLLRGAGPVAIFEHVPLCASFRTCYKAALPARDVSSQHDGRLLFRVLYRDIVEDLVDDRMKILKADITIEDREHFGGLAIRHYEDWLHEKLKSTKVAAAERTGSIRLPHYDLTELNSNLHSLLNPEQLQSIEWLRAWHNARLEVKLECPISAKDNESRDHELMINFDIPQVDYAFKAALITERQMTQMRLGQPHPVTLELSYSTKWSKKDQHEHDFVYDIDLAEPSWLLSGARTASFSLKEGGKMSFQLAVIPLLVGVLALPTITVRLADEKAASKAIIHVDLRSRNQMIIVVEDLKSTTVALGSRDSIGGDIEMIEAIATLLDDETCTK